MRNFFAKTDPIINILVILLSIFGAIGVFSTTYFPKRQPSEDFWQHLIFLTFGISIYFWLSLQRRLNFNDSKLLLIGYIGIIAALIIVLFLPSIGPKRWIPIGGFTFQPSEFAKIMLVLLTAKLWANGREFSFSLGKLKITISTFLQSFLLITPILVLIWRQPSLGNMLLVLGVFIWMWIGNWQKPAKNIFYLILAFAVFALILFIENIDINLAIIASIIILGVGFFLTQKKIIAISALVLMFISILAAFGGNFAWNNLLTDYQRNRIVAFSSDNDPLGTQWQVERAQIAIASGLLPGNGFLQGNQVNYGLLPYAYTDFMYAAVVEQFGLVGAAVVLGLLCLLIIRLLQIAVQSKEDFSRLVTIGVCGIIFFNTLVHVGMNLGIMPVTGVPLPFISYGGSALLVNFISLGLVQNLLKPEEKASKLMLNSKYWV